MKLAKLCLFVVLLPVVFSSCPFSPEFTVERYYKSTYLGAESFTLSGIICDANGKTHSQLGTKLIAKISSHEDVWTIESPLHNNQFSFAISTTDDFGQVLPIPNREGALDTAWDMFADYFFYCSDWPGGGGNDPDRDKKMYQLVFYLDSYKDAAYSLTELYDPHDRFLASTWYIYVPEPLEIKGTYTWVESICTTNATYDCDFSKAGWYKIVNKKGNDPLHTTGKNIKLQAIEKH